MLKRLFVALIIVAGLSAARVYFKDAKPVVPSPAAVEAPVPVEAPAPARTTASTSPKPSLASINTHTHTVRSRGDVAPEVLLERKRRGQTLVTSDVVAGAPLARYQKLNLKLGAPVKRVRHGYLPLAARAVPRDVYTSAMGPVLIEENDLRVVADEREGWASLRTSADGQPLMINPSSGRLVLVTGTIEVALPDVEAAEALASSETLSLLNYDRTIGIAYLKAPADYALLPALGRIGARPGVGAVELELVESRKAAR